MAVEIRPPSAVTTLTARGWRWTRLGWVTDGAVTRVRVAPLAVGAPDLDTLLDPFDRLHPIGPARRARKVSTSWLRAWVTTWPATAWPALPLAAPIDLPVTVIPRQLSPALAVVDGRACRLLLADAVGQGKTIEAGLLLGELTARGAADRVLILTPLSLRDQWRAELGARCRLESDVIDRAVLRARERWTPPGVNPFRAPGIVVLSIDLAKQPDVLARLAGVTWDALVIDEAHAVSGDSARAAAAAALGVRARLVLLLTATPHSGDAEAFGRLCAIGQVDGEAPLLCFRRGPERPAGRRSPKSCDVSPPRSSEERAAAAALARYVHRLDQAGRPESRLIAIVLRKRALSSPAALAASLRHRVAWLDRQDAPTGQPALPFDNDEIERSDDEQPEVLREHGLADPRVEATLLAEALAAAEVAVARWSKLRALGRLLRRTHDPVLVFTEYRDTLLALTSLADAAPLAVLHGGLNRAARTSALAKFAGGQVRVLVATDVAAEGLNLQRACRLVVHVELPWSPARLEQRNGRVDRIGQSRRVHIWRLLGDPLHESRIVAALSSRLARMRASGIYVASLPSPAAAMEPLVFIGHRLVHTGIDDDARRAAEGASRLRRLVDACRRTSATAGASEQQPTLAWRRVRPCGGGVPRGVAFVCLVPATTPGTRPELHAVHVALRSRPAGSPSRWLPALAAVAAEAMGGRPSELNRALAAREHALLAHALADQARAAGRWQGSLFERRAARVVEAARSDAAARTREHQQRLVELGASAAPGTVAVLALLVD